MATAKTKAIKDADEINHNFTPGPWGIASQNGCADDEGLFGICGETQINSHGKPYRTYVAQFVEMRNARLIAQAPRMFRCLQAIQPGNAIVTGDISLEIKEILLAVDGFQG